MAPIPRSLALGALLVGVATAFPAAPASAAATVTSAGTVVTVTTSEPLTVGFSCDGSGAFLAAGIKASPSVPCSAVTRVNVEGETGSQVVVGSDLNQARFAADPFLVADLGVGNDRAIETDRADTIDLGPGDDTVFIQAGGIDNTSITLGTGVADEAYFNGTDDDDTITAASSSWAVSASVSTSEGGSTRTVENADRLFLKGNGGDDTISVPGITDQSTVQTVILMGGTGDDTLTAGIRPGTLYGNEGSNVFWGSAAATSFRSSSQSDVIHPGSSGEDEVVDLDSGRSGDRTVVGAPFRQFSQIQDGCGAQSRVRPRSGGSRVVSSRCRPGIQVLPSTTARIALALDAPIPSLADVVIPGTTRVSVTGTDPGRELLDVTVPSGTWSTVPSLGSGLGEVVPTDPQWGPVAYRGVADADVAVHGPWADQNQSFAHRVVRDLLQRFSPSGPREAVRDVLNSGHKTRAAVVAELMASDEYRGVEVDQVFARFLDRAPDPGGRSYWINGLRSGKSLQKFRSQLFGSNEYFAKAGGTNAGFVRTAYFDVLGRLPDPAGEAYWVKKIQQGTGRGSVANAFLASTEARRAIVKDQFLRFALRLPTTAEAEQWVARLGQPTGEPSLVAFLAASKAYLQAG